MKNINWLVRAKNKAFWLALIPAVLLLLQTVGAVFGFSFDFANISDKLLAVVEALFMVLAIVGIVVDPTTEGVGDSEDVLAYTKPSEK